MVSQTPNTPHATHLSTRTRGVRISTPERLYMCTFHSCRIAADVLGLSLFTMTEFSLLLFTIVCWGNLMIAWGFLLGAVARNASSAILAFLVWLFASAFLAEFVLQEFLISGPQWPVRSRKRGMGR